MPQTIQSMQAITRSAADLSAVVNHARASRVPLVDYGVAHQGVGHAPPTEHTRLSIEAPAPVIEHYVRDLTVRVHAGARIADLHAALKENNQFLPIDADGDLTVGEVLNHNVYGALRPGYGSIRDLLLGLRYINGMGEDIGVGGRTVKNVAGYDVSRFLVGSLGTLGLIHEATIRTYARPARAMAIDLQLPDPAAIDPALSDWLQTDAAPQAMLLESAAAGWRIRIAYLGSSSACLAQLRSLEMFLPLVNGMHIVGSGECDLDAELSELETRRAWRRRVNTVVKLIVPPAATGSACAALSRAEVGVTLRIDALPVHGCIFVGGDLTAGQALSLDAMVLRLAQTLGGFRVWHARPPECGAAIPPFAPSQPEWPLLERIKKTMDPDNLFNPGRLTQTAPTR